MIHARKDYNRFQDPALDDPSLLSEGSTPIGADEPVMLFRAQDRHFIPLLEAYARLLCADSKAGSDIVYAVEQHIEQARKWQRNHATKTPDL